MKPLPNHAAMVRTLFAETKALVADGWTTVDELFLSLQAPICLPRGGSMRS
jgi:hypothetical protein